MNFDEYVELKTSTQKALDEASAGVIKELFAKLFDDVPELGTIKWQQGTPGFNDGAPCVFSLLLDTDSFYKVGSDLDEIDYGDLYCTAYTWDAEVGKVYFENRSGEISQKVMTFLRDVHSISSALEGFFGNGAEIVYTRDGFEVEDWWFY